MSDRKDGYYAGIDLHSNSSTLGIIDEDNRKVLKKKLPNSLPDILRQVDPYRNRIKGIVVESTYNWYWLVDGLQSEGYPVHLANPSAIKQYEGLKYSDDTSDAFHLAHLLQLNLLPQGYIYPKNERYIRDLLRKRLHLVRHRTSHIISFQAMINRISGKNISTNKIKQLIPSNIDTLFKNDYLRCSAKTSIESIIFLTQQIKIVEEKVKQNIRLKKDFEILKTIPGVGELLALTIMLETGDINRFSAPGNYASYCRCVNSKWMSNGKKKNEGNRKNGNKYLSWAFVEAANIAIRFYPEIKKYYQKKSQKVNRVVAIKAIGHKLARAAYWVMKKGESFAMEKAFC